MSKDEEIGERKKVYFDQKLDTEINLLTKFDCKERKKECSKGDFSAKDGVDR